jgi:hypothetical protein
MTPTERAQLAAVTHYDTAAARHRTARGYLPVADANRAMDIIARARRAELLDPDPFPRINRSADR